MALVAALVVGGKYVGGGVSGGMFFTATVGVGLQNQYVNFMDNSNHKKYFGLVGYVSLFSGAG